MMSVDGIESLLARGIFTDSRDDDKGETPLMKAAVMTSYKLLSICWNTVLIRHYKTKMDGMCCIVPQRVETPRLLN